MLAALLLHEPYPGGVDEEYEKGQRALENLRREHFERQDQEVQGHDEKLASPAQEVVYDVSFIDEIKELELPGVTASPGSSSKDDELALLFIIAES